VLKVVALHGIISAIPPISRPHPQWSDICGYRKNVVLLGPGPTVPLPPTRGHIKLSNRGIAAVDICGPVDAAYVIGDGAIGTERVCGSEN